MTDPEALARQKIDRQLEAAGWVVQDYKRLNLYAGRGVAVREFPVEGGEADYVLFVPVGGRPTAVGVVEAKPAGHTLSGVAEQAEAYAVGWRPDLPHVTLPLPFQYEANGEEVLFRHNNGSRRFYCEHYHKPFTYAIDDGVPNYCTYTHRLYAKVTNPWRKQDVATLARLYKTVESMLLKAGDVPGVATAAEAARLV